MHPILFSIFGLEIKTYGTLIAIGILCALFYIMKQAERENLDVQNALDITLYLVISGIIGARILYVIVDFRYYRDDLLSIFKVWEGGLVFYGGFLAALAVGYFLLKRKKMPPWKFIDIFATALPLGHAFGRVGCFSAGCCYGRETDVPWAVTFTNTDSLAYPVLGLHIHPTQIYESIFNLIIFFILHLSLRKKKFDGQNAILYVILYGTARFFLEFFRGDDRGFLFENLFSTSQGVALILVPVAIAFFIYKMRQPAETVKLKKEKKHR